MKISRKLIAALLFMGSFPALAQDYPSKPIHLLLPFAGGTDAVARLLAYKLSPALGQQVLPEQRLGAGGNIAHEAVARAAPDGYTLLMAAPPLVINPHLRKVEYDALRDFAPVAPLTAIPNALVVNPKVKAQSLAELVQLAKAEPGKLTYGSGGVGSANHLAMELFKSMAGVDIVHIPYKSATHALTAAVGGETDVVAVATSSAATLVKDGRMRALAVFDSKRSSAMPAVPTAAEQGVPLVAVNWYILLAPAGTPRAIVDKLNLEATRAMAAPDIQERLAGLGGEPLSGSPEDAAAYLKREYEQWGKIIRERNIHAD